MLYTARQTAAFPSGLTLSAEDRRQARAWYDARARRAFRGMLLLAIPMLIFPPMAVFFVLAAVVFKLRSAALSKNGLFVPAAPMDSLGNLADTRDASEAWARERPAGDDPYSETFRDAHGIAAFLGRFVPAVIAHYQFAWRGRTYRVGKYFLADEAWWTDERGYHWALVHPRFPRLASWLVSRS